MVIKRTPVGVFTRGMQGSNGYASKVPLFVFMMVCSHVVHSHLIVLSFSRSTSNTKALWGGSAIPTLNIVSTLSLYLFVYEYVNSLYLIIL